MAITHGDNEQDKLLSQHEARINMLERNVATLGQATASLTETTAVQSVHVNSLIEATRNNLEAIQAQAQAVTKLVSDTSWMKRIGYALLGVTVTAIWWYLQKALA